jgi:arylsulfatase A-like enzyme
MKRERGDMNIAVRDGRWKGIWNLELDSMEIYDLEADPGELRNLADEHPELVGTLTQQATTWLESCLSRARPPDGPSPLDDETKARLRAMGYLN